MRRTLVVVGALVALAGGGARARADEPEPTTESQPAGAPSTWMTPPSAASSTATGTPSSGPPPATSAPAAGPAPSAAPPVRVVTADGRGLVVVALGDASPVAWPLAQGVYADDALRPQGLDEVHARVLAGEAPAPGAPAELRDLADTRAAIRGDDAPSRQLLSSMAGTFHVRAIVVVTASQGGVGAAARVYLAGTGSFDAARYAPDEGAPYSWKGAVASLHRSFAGAAVPPAAVSPVPPAPPSSGGEGKSTPFYKSPWFWGAIGAAAFGATAVYFATRDNGSSTIHLQVQVPK